MGAGCFYRAVGAPVPASPGSTGAGLSGSWFSGCSRGGSVAPAPEMMCRGSGSHPSMAGTRQNSQDQSGSAGSTGCLPALLGRFCTSRRGEPCAHRFPGHRLGARAADLLHTWVMQWVLGSAPFLGCWAPGGTVLGAG